MIQAQPCKGVDPRDEDLRQDFSRALCPVLFQRMHSESLLVCPLRWQRGLHCLPSTWCRKGLTRERPKRCRLRKSRTELGVLDNPRGGRRILQLQASYLPRPTKRRPGWQSTATRKPTGMPISSRCSGPWMRWQKSSCREAATEGMWRSALDRLLPFRGRRHMAVVVITGHEPRALPGNKLRTDVGSPPWPHRVQSETPCFPAESVGIGL